MRDNFEKLTAANVKIFGVSMQDAASHKNFIDKNKFQFPLVVDDGTLAAAFGVPVRGEFASRQSILIDEDGKIQHIWRKVSASSHADDVLAVLGN